MDGSNKKEIVNTVSATAPPTLVGAAVMSGTFKKLYTNKMHVVTTTDDYILKYV